MPVLKEHAQLTFWSGSPMIIEAPEINAGAAKKLIIKDRITTGEAARILGIDDRTVRRMCEEGLLVWAQPHGERGRYQITLESVLHRLNANS